MGRTEQARDELTPEQRAELTKIRAEMDRALSFVAELQRGWNHGAKLVGLGESLSEHLHQARRSIDEAG